MPYQLPMEKMHAEKVHKLLQISVLRGMIYNSLWNLLEGGMERGCLWQNDHVPRSPGLMAFLRFLLLLHHHLPAILNIQSLPWLLLQSAALKVVNERGLRLSSGCGINTTGALRNHFRIGHDTFAILITSIHT